MSVDVAELREFYESPLGDLARRLVGRALAGFWPDLRGLGILGLGYPVPFLPNGDGDCRRALAFMPAAQGVTAWPAGGRGAAALVDPDVLPLPEGCLDRVLVVHALENVEHPAELLHEVWRVLCPGGRMLAVVPNRRGLWARIDTTPFGQGQPFSRSQLRALLRETRFSPEGWSEALYTPPLKSRVLLRSAPAWESVGAKTKLPFAGLHIVDATKELHRAVPLRAKRPVRGRVSPVLVSAPAPAARSRLFGSRDMETPSFCGDRTCRPIEFRRRDADRPIGFEEYP
jgi:SAM-dependent methyltransferase